MTMSRHPPKTTWSDQDLLFACLEGDPDCFLIMSQRLSYLLHLLQRLCAARGQNSGVARQLAQCTLRRAVESLRQRSGDSTRFGERDWLERLAREEFQKAFAKGALPPGELVKKASVRKLRRLYDRLLFDERLIVELILVREMSFAQASRALRVGEDEAKRLYRKSIEHLGDLMRGHG
jgi:DNA-directed RNA polymerase specialized sigma24 family protein